MPGKLCASLSSREKTLSEWYDTLIQKSEDYVQVLLHQANVQNLSLIHI